MGEAVDSYERAAELFIEAGNVQAAAEARFQVALMHGWNADGLRALSAVDVALRLLGAERSPLVFRLLIYKARVSGAFEDMEAGFATLAEAKLMEASLPEACADGYASTYEARLYWNAAQLERAGQCAREAIARFRAAGDLWGEADVWDPIVVALYMGRPTEAEALIRDSAARAERVGHQHAVWLCKNFSAEMYTALGDLERAEQAACESFESRPVAFDRVALSGYHRPWLASPTIGDGSMMPPGGSAAGSDRAPYPLVRDIGRGTLLDAGRQRRPRRGGGARRSLSALAGAGPPFDGWAPADAWHLSSKVSPGSAATRRLPPFNCMRNTSSQTGHGVFTDNTCFEYRPASPLPARTTGRAPKSTIRRRSTRPIPRPIGWRNPSLVIGMPRCCSRAAPPAMTRRARALLSEALAMFDSLGMPGYSRRTSERLASLGP